MTPAAIVPGKAYPLVLASLLVYLLADGGVITLNGQSQGILFILVFGAATDYALLFVARYREAVAEGQKRWQATVQAWRGAFHAEDVAHTARAVMGYGLGLMGLVAIKVLAPGFYARQDTRTPVRIAVGVLVLTQVFNAIFVFGLKIGVAGLSLSIGLGAVVNAWLLLRGLRLRGSYTPEAGWPMFLARVAVASAAMGALQWWLAGHFDWVGGRGGPFELTRAGWMALSLGGSALLYFGVLLLSGLNLRQFARRA